MIQISSNQKKVAEEYLNNLLNKIKKRPGMYLGKASITRLKIFLMGYSIARGELGLDLTEQEKQFSQFQQWVKRHYQIDSNQGWDQIILSQVNDEKLALNLFFDLLEKFYLDNDKKLK
ncbi:MAG: hypothetical protein QNJ33_09670 [Crocosphaera sp.]|nr:hypothetical protein [Crocosphaera sp.]